MRILYIHGFGSNFDANSGKCQVLKQLGSVGGLTLDYTLPFQDIKQTLINFILENPIDLIVGTSMGGFWASIIAEDMQLPFVAINPSVKPKDSMKKYVGKGKTYFGTDYHLTEATADSYRSFAKKGEGIILLDMNDEVIDANKTFLALSKTYKVHCFEGGNHRFSHLEESLPLIKEFLSHLE